MKRSKFTEEQVIYALRQAENGTPVGDVCRQLGVAESTFYAWKKKYAHLGVTELRRRRQLEEENARLLRRRKHIALHRGPAPVGPRERWSMDSLHDALADGRPFRILTVVDGGRVSHVGGHGQCGPWSCSVTGLGRVPSPWIME